MIISTNMVRRFFGWDTRNCSHQVGRWSTAYSPDRPNQGVSSQYWWQQDRGCLWSHSKLHLGCPTEGCVQRCSLTFASWAASIWSAARLTSAVELMIWPVWSRKNINLIHSVEHCFYFAEHAKIVSKLFTGLALNLCCSISVLKTAGFSGQLLKVRWKTTRKATKTAFVRLENWNQPSSRVGTRKIPVSSVLNRSNLCTEHTTYSASQIPFTLRKFD